MDSLHLYLLQLADNNLILGHRNSEWCGHGPILEQDIALTNISLDLIGQARYFYQYAAERQGSGVTEDSLAYMRDSNEFLNILLVELPNKDWGFSILRQYLYSQFQHLFYEQMKNGTDQRLAEIAAKAIKETAYHVRWSKEWVIRLGDGTIESRNRLIDSWELIRDYTGELFITAPFESDLLKDNISVDLTALKSKWETEVARVFEEATIPLTQPLWMQQGGKQGHHTEHLGYILAEMQFMQRAYPGLEW